MDGVVSLNLASMYLQIGEVSGAMEESRRAVTALARVPGSPYRAHALAQSAKLKARTGDLDSALPEFFGAIREADALGDVALKSLVTNQLGFEYLDKGRLEDAESAMSEAFRLRLLGRRPELGQSYRALGMLRLAQGRLPEATILFDRAVDMAERSPGRVPSWEIYYGRGAVSVARERLSDALRDFRTALQIAREWRLEILPADTLRTSAEVDLRQLYSAFIRTASELYFETGRTALAREAFAAAEELRTVSLRAAISANSGWRDRLPAEYGETLAQLRAARLDLLRSGSPDRLASVSRLRNRLTEMEVRAGLDATPEFEQVSQLARAAAEALSPAEALFSFHISEPSSYVWIVTRDSFELHRVAGARLLRQAISAWVESLQKNSPESAALGQKLYAELLGSTGPRALARRSWLLAVEDALLTLPFAALTSGYRGSEPQFLIENHALSIIPGALVLERPVQSTATVRGPFLGIGDPIYNAADDRWKGGARAGSLQLARLAGSGLEIRSCAKAWPSRTAPLLFEGGAATRRAVVSALASAPSVIHFATHVIRSRENPARRLIPLSLLPSGDLDLVGPEDITTWRLPAPALVVISGCASGAPERRLPSFQQAQDAASEVGLVGLSRAWLSAGARAVAVTLWPTPDDAGDLFLAFYRNLAADDRPTAALALARAQVEMLHSRTWHSIPRNWAAYLIVGRG